MYFIYSYSSFMNYYLFYFRCIYYSVSVICDYIYLLYTFSFAKFKLTTRYFEQFNCDISVFLYTYNGCEWSKISCRYSWYQSFGSSRQNLTYRVNLFTESLSFEFQSLPLTQFLEFWDVLLGSEIHSCPSLFVFFQSWSTP